MTEFLLSHFVKGYPEVNDPQVRARCGNLAGLVGITAPCATVDALGAILIGAVDGILVVLVVELLDFKLHIDDPVGAVAVHCANGIWGTVADGLFNTTYRLTARRSGEKRRRYRSSRGIHRSRKAEKPSPSRRRRRPSWTAGPGTPPSIPSPSPGRRTAISSPPTPTPWASTPPTGR